MFQRFINTVFQNLVREGIVSIYIDDLIIPARNEEENLMRLRKVLAVAEKNGLIIQWPKCRIMQKQIEFLGHIVEAGSFQPSQTKTKAIREFPIPKNVRQQQSFLGLTNVFRKFVQGYALIAKPLSDLTKKDKSFKIGDTEMIAFETLKQALCNEPVLKMYNPNLETELHTDASKFGFGGCLLQKHDCHFHPVFFISFKAKDTETRYSSYELEVLAIIKSIKMLRVYLLGINFKIYTDCKAFQLTMKKKDIIPRISR